MLGTDARSGLQTFRRVGRRHPDVDDRDIRIGFLDEPHQPVHGAGLTDHLEPGRRQRRRERLAEESGVVGEDYPHGIAALTVVPPPGGLSTMSSPPTAATRSASPCSPEPGDAAAPPGPSSRTTTRSDPGLCSTTIEADAAGAYLATFVSASETT